jgi:glucose-1-phosphate cytidylyltransferase
MHMTNTPDTADIPVVILCGGQGTRIREASEKLPKPLIDIGGKPILWHIMKIYSEHGFRRFVLCLGYKAWDIKEHFLRYKENNSDFTLRLGGGEPEFHSTPSDDFEISFVDTGLMTGTGGRIGRVAHLLDQEHFMLTYGDGIGNVDLSAEFAQHVESGKIGTVTGVVPTSRFGELGVDGDTVVDFAEKPDTGGRVSGGFFAFKTDFLRYITSETDLFLEQEPLRKLASDGELGMYRHNGFWMGMDTFREYSALNDMWENDLAPWRTWAD